MKSISRPRSWLSLGLCLSLFTSTAPKAALSGARQIATPVERSEYFLIEWDSTAPHPGVGYDGDLKLGEALLQNELGLVELRCRFVKGEWQMEQDVVFPFEDVRLMAVENLDEKTPGLIWREIMTGAGRTLFAEWSEGGGQLNAREWSPRGSTRSTHRPEGRLHMPLSLIEATRNEQLHAGPQEVFDPLRGQIETWELRLSSIASENLAPERIESGSPESEDTGFDGGSKRIRTAEFYRADGSFAGGYQFAGGELLEFRWQLGGLRMTRMTSAEHADRRVLWGLDEK